MADVEITLQGGVKVKIPEEQAALYTEARKKDKDERDQLGLAVTAAKAEKDAEAAKALKAEEDKKALELAKTGEVDKVRELLTSENKKKVDSLAQKYRDTHLESMVARSSALLKLGTDAEQSALVKDVVAQLRSSCQFDLERDTLVVIGADGRPALGSDGKPKTADAALNEFLEARSYLRQPTSSGGSGGAGSGKGAGAVGTIKQSQYDHKNAEQARALASGKLKIVDG